MQTPQYEALNDQGYPYNRPAKRIDELPYHQVKQACASATQTLSMKLGVTAHRDIAYGAPAYTAFMTRPEAKKHPERDLLMMLGCELPLYLCPDFEN